MTRSPATPALLAGFSLEMTARDAPDLTQVAPLVPTGTRINLTFLGTEDLDMRVKAARAAREAGLIPVPHIAARRLTSERELDEFLTRLHEVDAAEHLTTIGGDPSTPLGPFEDALGVITSGLLTKHGVRSVAVAGYPEGHPDIPTDRLWDHLERKLAALSDQGLEASVLTQFSFDTAAVRSWVEQVRDRGITAPIRIGVPGPVTVRRLLGFARRFGVASNARIVRKFGFSLTNLMGTAGPDTFVTDLAGELADLPGAGDVGLHFYTFGGLVPTAEWIRTATTEHT